CDRFDLSRYLHSFPTRRSSDLSFENSTIDDFSKDAIAALQYLKQVEKVDINKIGIIGHSEGGLIANLLAGQGLPNLSYIVTLAGDRKSTRLNSSHVKISYAVFC